MKLHFRILSLIFLVIINALAGCSTNQVQTGHNVTSTPKKPIATSQALQLTKENLQLTFLQFDHNQSNLVARDVNCFQPNKDCPDEPSLLFQSTSQPDDQPTIPFGLIEDYDWSPNGKEVVFASSGDLWLGSIVENVWKNITNSLFVDERSPLWSRDGKSIYFLECSQELGYGSCKLVRLRLDTNDRLTLPDSINSSINSFAVSPNETMIVYSASENYEVLFQSDIDGLNPVRITVMDAEETSPVFSPDGGKIAFVRLNGPTLTGDSESVSDIIVLDLVTGEEKNLTDNFEDKVSSPAFSPDGKSVAFVSFDKNLNANIYVASIDPVTIYQITHGNIDKTNPSWRIFYSN